MFYDLGVLLKQKSTDLGTLYRQSIINMGTIIKPEKFIYILITEDDYILITEDESYKLIV